MVEFIFTKEKVVALREEVGMRLQKHTIDEIPPIDKELLMVIDIRAANGYNLWTVGTWDGNNWSCPFDEIGYTVIKWYILPPQKRERAVEDYSYYQF